MRILWPHSFPPQIVSSGVFMHAMRQHLEQRDVEIRLLHLPHLGTPTGICKGIHAVRKFSVDCDVVHAQFGSVCGWVSSFAKKPRLLTLRGTDVFGIERGSLGLRLHGYLSRMFTFQSLPAYSRVVTVSHQMRRMVEGHCRQPNLAVIPSGIDLQRFQPIRRETARARLQKSCSKKWVLVAATFASNPVKRWPLAKAAFEIVQQKRDDVELHMVAGIDHEQMPLWMSAADVVLVTSTHEGWPNIVKEALACNTPFVSTDVGDLRNVAEKTKNCMVTDDAPEALAEAILRALNAGKQEDLRRHVAEMDITTIGDRYLAIYRELADMDRKPYSVAGSCPGEVGSVAA